MATVNLEVPSAGEKIQAGLHATNYADIQAALNGGLDASNLAAGAVTAPKLSLPYTGHTLVWTASGTAPSLGNATVVSRYIQIGKLVHYFGQITFGSTTTYGTGTYSFSLPVASVYTQHACGVMWAYDSSTTSTAVLNTTVFPSGVFQASYASTYLGAHQGVSNTGPYTWAVGDALHWGITYESA